jgi:oligosaccharide reducing-end xylanase
MILNKNEICMRNKIFYILMIFIIISIYYENILSSVLNDSTKISSRQEAKGAFYSGSYHNLFKELLNKSESEIKGKVNAAFQQLFYGSNDNQRIYYPVGNDMAYVEDINNNDVRTEGMSYGMMISVQLDKKQEFDKIWKWAVNYMHHNRGQRKDYFAWHCKTNGEIIDSCTASDGEEWFVTSLLFADERWGSGNGIFNYKEQAQKILDAMLSKTEFSDDRNVVTNIFNKTKKQVVFVPSGEADDFTDPSYHLPHFYEVWAMLADKENKFWKDVADTSRIFLARAVNPITGLAPDYAHFDGTPYNFWGDGNDNFRFDAWRVAMNVAVDYSWFAKDDWEVFQSNRLLNFFYSKGIKTYGSLFTLDGNKYSVAEQSTGLVTANAVAALVSTNENRKEFVEQLWEAKIPTGHYRYYDGVLYMLGLLQVTGNFRIYNIHK